MSGVINIAYIVASVMNELGITSLKDRERITVMAKEGIEHNNIYHGDSVEVAYLKMDSATKTVKLPADYIDYVAIGVEMNGAIWTLGRNDNMALASSQPGTGPICETIDEAATVDVETLPKHFFPPHYYGTSYRGGLYAIGGGFNRAYYKLDKARRLIRFSNEIPGKDIYLEYISTGLKDINSTVPRESLEVIKSWCHWKLIEYDERKSLSDKMRKENLWEKAMMEYDQLNLSFTKDEFLDTMYRAHTQTAKR